MLQRTGSTLHSCHPNSYPHVVVITMRNINLLPSKNQASPAAAPPLPAGEHHSRQAPHPASPQAAHVAKHPGPAHTA